MGTKTTVRMFQAEKKWNLPREDLAVAKKGKP